MDLFEIQKRCIENQIEVTNHMLIRLQQREISFSEVKEAIRNSEIIEEYPNDYPYPSCLLLGITLQNRIIHIVVGLGETKLWLITAYEPDPIKWSADFKVRKD